MKIFTNQSIWKKIVIALLIVLLFNAVIMKPVHADSEDGDVLEFGGKLMSPILSLFVSLGDGIMDIIGRTIMGATSTLYEVEMGSTFWETLGTILVAIAAAVVTIVAIVATAGLAAVALAAVSITVTATVGMGTIIAGLTAGVLAGVWFNDQVLPEDLYLPMYTYSAEEIFKGNILLFDVNFFKNPPEIKENQNSEGKIQYYYYINDKGEEVKTSNQSSAALLTKTVSSWYNALRNICLVLMLSVLVYIGIRMLLSSVASDKAKYLTMLKDWFIGLCLLFLMHYIMAFSVTLVEKLVDVVKSAVDEKGYVVVMEANDKLKEAVDEDHLNQPDAIQENNGIDYLNWPTNLMGSLRLQVQMAQYGASYIGLCICFLMLCLFTLYFTVTYLKRVLYMAFLTLIAPMVALTYCIDKLNDGQAQGFNKWFKEYIFNLLIQPMHLLLYYILVTSAFELASTNVIYSIVAIGFMIPAEKLLRSLFGFEKAHTPPAMGPAGAMMASSALTHLLHKGPRGKGEGGNGNLDGDESDFGKVPQPKEANPISAFLNNGENSPTEEQPNSLDNSLQAGHENEEQGANENNSEDPIPRGLQQAGDGSLAIGADEVDENDSGDYSVPRGLEEAEDGSLALGIGGEEDEKYQGLRDAWRDSQEYLDSDKRNNQKENEQQPEEDKKQSRIATAGRNAGRRIKRMAHASWAAQKASMRNAPKKFVRKLENSHPIRTVGKIAAGAAVGAAAGAVGLAIGATTGDLSNVVKVGGGAAAAGFSLGSGRAQSIGSPMQDSTIQEVRNDAYNKGEYKQDAMDDYVKKYRKDVRNRNYFEQTFGKEEAKEMLKEGGEVEQYLKNDITDKNEMKAMHKLQKDGIVKNTEEAIAISQLGTMIGSDTRHMTTKRRNEWTTRIGDMAGESGVKEKEKFAENRLKQIDKLHDYKR